MTAEHPSASRYDVNPDDPQLQAGWTKSSASDATPSITRARCCRGGDFDKARSTYERCIDAAEPDSRQQTRGLPHAVRFTQHRQPAFLFEIAFGTMEGRHYLQIRSSVMNFFTSDGQSIPRELVLEEDGTEPFLEIQVKGLKRGETVHNNFVNYITNYPYPYVINNCCWQLPCVAPSDWSAQHLHGINNPKTIEDWKRYLDICVLKQGTFNLIFHPHGWITAEQVNDFIDYAVAKHGKKVKFLNFREAADRLNAAFGNTSLRDAADDVVVKVIQREYRANTTADTDIASLPDAVRDALLNARSKSVLPLRRDDGSHNGVFVRDSHVCWMNEDTAHLPDLIHRVSFDDLNKAAAKEDARRNQPPVPIGAAIVDITPDHPVRLTGYGNRMTESEGIAVRIHSRALAIGGPSPTVAVTLRVTSPADSTNNAPASSAEATFDCCHSPEHPDHDAAISTAVKAHHAEHDGYVEQPLAVLITVDNCGVPASITEQVFAKVAAKHNIPRERFAISSTHTHSGPWLRDFAPNIFAEIPEDHAEHLKQYEAKLIDQLVEVADQAITARRPGNLSLAFGELGFAMNRRVLNNGQWTGFGEVPDGPTDKRFPVLAAHDTDGKLIAVLANYACHATTETGSFNQISGDWPGFAADMIEADLHEAGNKNAVALIAIGCGADANPSPRGTHEQGQQHGRSVADEVKRLLNLENAKVAVTLRVTSPSDGTPNNAPASSSEATPENLDSSEGSDDDPSRATATLTTAMAHHAERDGYFDRIDPMITCSMLKVDLPLGPVPSREDLEALKDGPGVDGSRARYFLKLLDDGKPIPTTVPDYPVQTWCFGKDLAMVFLGGEVVVDYSIRMNDMFDGDRLWINAYSNDVPCYIASKRVLREGGYEADSSMRYYRRPTRLAPEAEDIICDTVQKLLPHEFYSEQLRADFPAPKSPEESLAAITVRPGLRVELVAAEPLITDPVAFDWDVSGRLWVAEMGGYPVGDGRTGRVRVLEDTDGDGQYDRATTFLDGLSFPSGIHPWRHGWLITCAPDIIYAEDTDGDFVADQQTVLYTGFTEGNQQHRVNGMRWGLDGWLYLANGDSGGDVRAVHSVSDLESEISSEPISSRGRDLRIQPDTGAIETLSGQTQFGRERDDFGNWFGNNNSNPIWHYVLEERYLKRNPFATGLETKAQVAEIPGAAPVFPTSKTLSRFNDFGAANRFTSACSTSIYRDHLLGDEFYGNAFTCEPVHNLVSRLVLERDGITFKGRRGLDEKQSEFFASADNWTRPVMVRTGPDGAIWIADMYRQVIEHPQWIPAEYQRKLDLYAGNAMGRIYRVVRNEQQITPAAGRQHDWYQKPASAVLPETLVERLASPNGWWRDTAQRLLLHHHREDFAVNRLIETMMSHKNPAVRVHAMWTLSQVGDRPDFNASLFANALQDEHPEVRRAAIELLEPWIADPHKNIPPAFEKLTQDPSAFVRRQLALSLGASPHPAAAQLLVKLMLRSEPATDELEAVRTSLSPQNIRLVIEGVMAHRQSHAADHLLWQLASQAVSMKKPDVAGDIIALLLQNLSGTSPAESWTAAADSWSVLNRSLGTSAPNALKQALPGAHERAIMVAVSEKYDPTLRAAALQFVASSGSGDDELREKITELLRPATPNVVQTAAVSVVARSETGRQHLLKTWKQLTPAIRSRVVSVLLENREQAHQLLDAVQQHQITPSDLDAVVREQLLNHRDNDVRIKAVAALGQPSTTARSEVVENFRFQISNLKSEISDPKSGASAGKAVFEKRCATCHRIGDIGKQIGADLAALKDRSTDALLTAILDPNKAVEARFLSYTAVTTDGRTFSGMLLNETGNSLTLLGTDGKEQVVARADLEELVCSNRSLMPEGLEKDLSVEDLAGVIAFVQSFGITFKRFDGNEPRLITPSADGSITLPAGAAEIYGPNLVFEQKYGNLGWWSSTDDYAVWNIDVPESGFWSVELDYACDNNTAGNVLKLSTGTRLLSVRIPGTGTWDDYRSWTAGEIDLGRGRRQLIVTAPEKPTSALIDLRSIRLIRRGE
ncbi:MAG: neutral/alkaline non-lysosomal ceramidase N-terminal domain-containing protein [Planctomycetaceae bacterium]